MSSKKKVLFVANTDSFIELFLLPYLKVFKDSGYQVHVATNTSRPIPFCDKKIHIPIERSPKKIISNLKAVYLLKKVIEAENYNIIHCHTPMGGAIARLAARKVDRLNTKIIYTAHGFHFYKGAPLHYWMIFYPVEKYLAKYTDTLITINGEDFERAIRKFSKKCHDIKYIPGIGIDENKFKKPLDEKQKQDLRKSLNLKDSDIVLTCIGRLDANKNQGFLIDTIRELAPKNKNYKLLLIGTDEFNGKYQKQAADLKNNVIFTGFKENVFNFLQISDLVISTSKREGLPVNIMEAMHYGLPCIVTNCRGNRDLIKNDHGGKVIPIGNKNSLISAIEYFYNSKNARKKYGNFNLNEVKKYGLDVVEEEYKKIYFRKKKIVYTRSDSIYTDSRAQKEIKALQKEYDVVVLGWDREQKYRNKEKNYNRYILFDKKAGYGAGLKNLFNLLQFQKWLKKKLEQTPNIDLIYACDFDTAYTAGKFAKKHRIKFVYDIYDYYTDCHRLPKIAQKIVEAKDIKTINNSNLTIICSEERVRQIKKATPQKVIVIHNSIDLDNYTLKDSFCKSPENNKTKIAYVGTLQDHRLLKEVAEKIKSEKDLELHIGGFGQYAEYFQNLAKNCNNIFFYGQLEYPEVLSLEKDCDILFATYDPKIPNHKYSAPNKVYEAISLKKPIVVCKNTGVDKIVARNDLGTVINYDSKEFMEAIKNIHPTDRKNDIILNKYGWDTMEKRLLENVEKVLG